MFNKLDIMFEIYENRKFGEIAFMDGERKSQEIMINNIEVEDGRIEIDFEEIDHDEYHEIKRQQKYVQELAENLKDEVNVKMLLEDVLGDMTEEEREELMERLEESEDTSVNNNRGCHYLTVGGKPGKPQKVDIRP